MYGNIGEWVANWYVPGALTDLYSAGNLYGPRKGFKRVTRGGAWDEKIDSLRSTYRDPRNPESFGASLGFRCARATE
jgi:formylglycine-generating enzyme required for sulfatase activity